MRRAFVALVGLISAGEWLWAEEQSFGAYLPADCAIYVEVYNKKGLFSPEFREIFNEARKMEVVELDEITDELPVEALDVVEGIGDEEIETAAEVLGTNFAFAIGGEGIKELEELGGIYQSFYEATAGAQLDVFLSLLASVGDGEFNPEDLLDDLGGEDDLGELEEAQFEKFFDFLTKEESLAFPSIYLAMKPQAKLLEEAWGKVGELEEALMEDEGERGWDSISIEDGKWPARGATFKLTAASEGLQEWWEQASDEERGPLNAERIEKLVTKVSTMEFTVLFAKVDEWLVVYAGNGEEGFKLKEGEGLSSNPKLTAVTEMSGEPFSWVRWLVSQELLEVAPNWLDGSGVIEAWGEALEEHSELTHQKEMSTALSEISKNRRLLSRRKVDSDWCGVGWWEDGLRMEMIGGITDPGLNYHAPWTLSGGAEAAGGFVRAQWVGNSSQEKWNLRQIASFLDLTEAALGEWMPEGIEPWEGMVEEDLMGWAKTLSDSAQEMSGAGLGDECVFAMDLLGVVPPIPNVEEEFLEEGRSPRVLFARSVDDREVVAKTGKAMFESTKKLWGTVAENLGEEWPFPGMMTSEDNGLATQFMLVPFSNDDFVPSVSLGDDILILSSSRNQTAAFEKGRKKVSDIQTGFLFEVDLSAGVDFLNLWNDLSDSALLPLGQADSLLDDLGLEGEGGVKEQMEKLQKIRYHHRQEDGELRTSFSFELKKK